MWCNQQIIYLMVFCLACLLACLFNPHSELITNITFTIYSLHKPLMLLHVWCSPHKPLMFSTQISDVLHKKPLMFFTQTYNILHTNLQFFLYINLWCSSHKLMIFSTQTSDFLSPNLWFSPHKPDVLHTNLWFSPHELVIFSMQTYDFPSTN